MSVIDDWQKHVIFITEIVFKCIIQKIIFIKVLRHDTQGDISVCVILLLKGS